MVYYNENDPKAVRWLEELIAAGELPVGVVDSRSITEVQPEDLEGFTQCHFFAGIGGWAYALKLAGWPEDQPVWTGSCPCQPFSAAGKGKGVSDARHLWPEWFSLIAVCCPAIIFGEQVASKAGLTWLDLVSADLENADYAVGAADLCAAGVGAPNIRQRLWFVADTLSAGRAEGGTGTGDGSIAWSGGVGGVAVSESVEHDRQRDTGRGRRESSNNGNARRLGHADEPRLQGRWIGRDGANECPAGATGVAGEDRMADAECRTAKRHGHELGDAPGRVQGSPPERERLRLDARDGGQSFWSPADWLPCRDGKWRPVEPGTFPLAHGLPARMGRLRGYGNAINPYVAAEFIQAYQDVVGGQVVGTSVSSTSGE